MEEWRSGENQPVPRQRIGRHPLLHRRRFAEDVIILCVRWSYGPEKQRNGIHPFNELK
jgi:hypothetical protein